MPLRRGEAPAPSRGEELKGPKRRGRSGSSAAAAARRRRLLLQPLPPSRFALHADEGKAGRAGAALGRAAGPGSREGRGGLEGKESGSLEQARSRGRMRSGRWLGSTVTFSLRRLPPAGPGPPRVSERRRAAVRQVASDSRGQAGGGGARRGGAPRFAAAGLGAPGGGGPWGAPAWAGRRGPRAFPGRG